MNFKRTIFLLGLVCVLSATLSGCDQVKSKLASLVSDPSPSEMALRLDKMVLKGDHQKAIQQGEAYLDKNPDPDGIVSEVVVDAYMASNDSSGVVAHLQKYRVRSSQSSESISESSSSQTTQSSQSSSNSVVAVDGASVVNTKKGTVVRAGDAVVVMPK